MSFRDSVNRMFSLYGNQDYAGALDVVREMRRTYPDESNRITFWEACLLSRSGQLDASIAVLTEGLDRGEWWPTGRLADADLDPIRTLPEFQSIASRCSEITQEKMADRSEPIVIPHTTGGTLLAIQGAHAGQQKVASTWHNAVPSGWGVITPAGSEPSPEGGWSWPYSVELGARTVLDDIVGLEQSTPFVLSGFSIGVAIASHIINAAELGVDGFIALAPASPGSSDFSELVEATSEFRL